MKVIVTRPREQAGPLVARLEALGHEVVACPLIEIEPLTGPVDVKGYEWVIVTSPNGARELVSRARGTLPKVAAVGPGTAETLRELGIEPAFVPRVSSQDGLIAEFPRPAGRVLFAAAEGARQRPIEELGADFVPLYRTHLVRPATRPEGDVVVLASGSAARSFAELGTDIPVVSIGPQTTKVAVAAGLQVVAEAETHDLDGLLSAVSKADARAKPARPEGGAAGGALVYRRPDVFVTFLTDFGLEDDFVGTCHGVMKRIAPDLEIIDITHGIQRHGVLQGALVLSNTLPYLPEGVHLAVVDPGVGTERRALALRSDDGRLFVGPDNGLLMPAAEKLGGIDAAHEITNREYALERVSATFHGRDIFSPAAAHLARGVAVEELGPAIEVDSLVQLDVPQPQVTEKRIRACCLYVDRFGNMQLNLTRQHLDRLGIEPGVQVELELASDRYYATAARKFADARGGEIILYEDAYENIAIAISGGSAAETFSAHPGVDVRIRVAD